MCVANLVLQYNLFYFQNIQIKHDKTNPATHIDLLHYLYPTQKL